MFSRQHENKFTTLTLHRIDPARRMARFYAMDVCSAIYSAASYW